MWKGYRQIASKYTSAFLNPFAADVLKSSASGFRFCNVHKMCLTTGETKTVLKTEIFQSYIEIWKVSDKCQTLWQLSGMLHEHHFVVSRTEMCVIHILTVWGLMITLVSEILDINGSGHGLSHIAWQALTKPILIYWWKNPCKQLGVFCQ